MRDLGAGSSKNWINLQELWNKMRIPVFIFMEYSKKMGSIAKLLLLNS